MSVRPSLRAVLCLSVAALVLTVAAPVAAAKPDRTPPTTPTNLRVTAVTQTSVSLAWNPSTDNSKKFWYVVWADGVSGVTSVTPPAKSVTIGSLRPGTTYTFRVQAWDAAYNSSSPSNPVTVTTQADTTAPTTPSGLTIVSAVGSKVLLRWNSGTDAFSPVRHEVLVDGVVTPNAWSTVTPGTFPRPAVQGAWVRQLDPSTTHTFTVRAIDPSGNVSAVSNAVSATTPANSDTVAPTTPVLRRVSDGGTGYCPEELWINWDGSTDDVDAPTAIEYEVRVNGAINEVVPGAPGTITYTEVLGANRVTIVAVDAAGNASPPSNAITAHTNWGVGSGNC